jgi:hypothetical protein
MTRLMSLMLKIYVLGIAIQLVPTIHSAWDTIPAAQLYANVVSELPDAASWPARAYRVVQALG